MIYTHPQPERTRQKTNTTAISRLCHRHHLGTDKTTQSQDPRGPGVQVEPRGRTEMFQDAAWPDISSIFLACTCTMHVVIQSPRTSGERRTERASGRCVIPPDAVFIRTGIRGQRIQWEARMVALTALVDPARQKIESLEPFTPSALRDRCPRGPVPLLGLFLSCICASPGPRGRARARY